MSAKSLDRLIGKNNLVIVDARNFSQYSDGHIPGAINIDLMQFHWIDTSKAGIKEFNRQSRQILSNIGVSEKKQVVFYDDISGAAAARGVWLLMYFSHRKVFILDGGFDNWKSAGLRVETRTNAFEHSNFRGKPNPKLLATKRDVKSALASESSTIIDSRTKDEFSGRIVRAARGGHIPGAINIDWQRNIGNSTFKDRPSLEKLYSVIPRASNIITYCQGGYRAANTFIIMHELGFPNIKMYLGSWGEWGNSLEVPVE